MSTSLTSTSVTTPIDNRQLVPQPSGFLSFFPPEIVRFIFSKLRPNEIHSLVLTDRHTSHFVLNDSNLWETILRKHFPLCSFKNNDEFLKVYKKELSHRNIIIKKQYRKRILLGHQSFLVHLSSCGNRFASVGLAPNHEYVNFMWDAEHEKKLKQFRVEGQNTCLYEDKLFSNNHDAITVYDTNNGKLLYKIEQDLRLRSVSDGFVYCSPLYPIGDNNFIKVFDAEKGNEIFKIILHPNKNYTQPIVSGTNLLVVDDFSSITIIDIESGKEKNRIQCHDFQPSAMVSNGKELYCIGKELRRVQSQEFDSSKSQWKSVIGNELFLCDGPYRYSTLKVFDMATGEELRKTSPFNFNQVDKMFPIGGMLILCKTGPENRISILDLETEKLFKIDEEDFRYQTCSIVMSNGKLFLQRPRDKEITIFDFNPASSLEENCVPFLVDLGIVSRSDCSIKLECTPEDLQNMGLSFVAELKALGIGCASIEKLPPSIIIPHMTTPHSQLQEARYPHVLAETHYEALSTTLKNLMDVLSQRITEAEENPSTYDEKIKNSWKLLLSEWTQWHNMFLDMKNQPIANFLHEFNGTGYFEKAKFINECIDEFNALDKEHQVAKLRAHVLSYRTPLFLKKREQ